MWTARTTHLTTALVALAATVVPASNLRVFIATKTLRNLFLIHFLDWTSPSEQLMQDLVKRIAPVTNATWVRRAGGALVVALP